MSIDALAGGQPSSEDSMKAGASPVGNRASSLSASTGSSSNHSVFDTTSQSSSTSSASTSMTATMSSEAPAAFATGPSSSKHAHASELDTVSEHSSRPSSQPASSSAKGKGKERVEQQVNNSLAAGKENEPRSAEEIQAAKEAVEKVLKRAEGEKLVRAFRDRMALAAFKAQRGLQGLKLDELEPHVANGSIGGPVQYTAAPTMPMPPPKRARDGSVTGLPNGYAHHQHQQHPQMYDPNVYYAQDPHVLPHGYIQHQQVAYGGGNPYDAYVSTPYQAPMPYSTSAPPTMQYAYMPQEEHLPKRRRLPSYPYGATVDQYGNVHHALPQQQHYGGPQQLSSSPVGQGGRRMSPHRRQSSLSHQLHPSFAAGPMHPLQQHQQQHPSSQQRGEPLSSKDPNFSQFVNAANALTGLSRAPSEGPSVASPGRSNTPGLGDSLPQQQQLQNIPPVPLQAPTPQRTTSLQGGPAPFATGSRRPTTPVRSAPPSHSGQNGEQQITSVVGPGGAADAAELMLYLAASPSPAQVRSGADSTGVFGDKEGAAPMKGRKLFADIETSYGSLLDRPLSADPFGTSSSVGGGTPSYSGNGFDDPFGAVSGSSFDLGLEMPAITSLPPTSSVPIEQLPSGWA